MVLNETTMRHSISMKHFIFLLSHFSLLLLLLLFSLLSWDDSYIIKNWAFTASLLAIFFILIHVISFYNKKVHYTDFRLWFLILSYLFMFGRVFLHGFNLDSEVAWNLMYRYPQAVLYHTSLYILSFMQCLFIGFFFFNSNKKNDPINAQIAEMPYNKTLYTVGLMIFLFSIPNRLLTDVTMILQAQTTGSYLTLEHYSGLADEFAFLMIPGIIYIISSGKLNRKKSLIILAAAILYFVGVMILSGDRRYQTSAIVALTFFYLRIFKPKLSWQAICAYGLFAILLLNLLAAIRNIRAGNLTSLSDFFLNYGSEILSASVLIETLSEFGLSFFSVVNVINYIPYYFSYQYGMTFLLALLLCGLPVGSWFTDLLEQASFSNIINKMDGTPVGASFIGDCYINFGWFSLGIGLLFGILCKKLLNMSKASSSRLECAKYYQLFYVFIILVRATFGEAVRASMWVYFVPLFILWVVKSINIRIRL